MTTGPWNKVEKTLSQIDLRLAKTVGREVGIQAKRLKKAMVIGIRSKKFGLTENAPLTVAAKGSSTPLIDKGDLIGNINDRRLLWSTSFVGLLRQARNRKGGNLCNIGMVHVKGTKNIPKRDFITPAVKEREKDFGEGIEDAVKIALMI